jgi:hypothetical protein
VGRYLEIAERALLDFGSFTAGLQGYDINDRNDQRSESPTRSPISTVIAVNLMFGTCADCLQPDDGSTSVVILAMLPDKPWRHAQCYSRWINEIGAEGNEADHGGSKS